MKVFAVIDQAAEARHDSPLRETTLVIFGSPAVGTPVMAIAPLAALDLPLKVLVWTDDGQTRVSDHSPAALAAGIASRPTSPGTWRASARSTDALVASYDSFPCINRLQRAITGCEYQGEPEYGNSLRPRGRS